jgi:hypothetical protein
MPIKVLKTITWLRPGCRFPVTSGLLWQAARWDRSVALMCFGMAPAVISIISALTPHQILTVASRGGASVKIRWASDLQFWEDLLLAAKSGDEKSLQRFIFMQN